MDSNPPQSAEALLEHATFLRALARRLLFDEQKAEDVVQETYLAALRHPHPLKETRAWLSSVVRNLAHMQRRGDVRRDAREAVAARPEGSAATVDVVAQLEVQRQLVEAVHDLEEPYRTVLMLRYYSDLPPREIAARQGVKIDTVKTQLKRGLKRLRERLDQSHGGDRRAWSVALLPLVFPDAAKTTAAAGATAGVVIMSLKTKVLAAALVVAALVAWQITSQGTNPGDTGVRIARNNGGAGGATALAVHDAVDRDKPEAQPAKELGEEPAAVPNNVTRVIGTVTADGRPVENALVWSASGRTHLATHTDAAGGFRFDMPANDTAATHFAIGVAHKNHAPGRVLKRFQSGRTIRPAITLEPDHTLDVLVLGADGRPAVGAEVVVVRAGKPGERDGLNEVLENRLDSLLQAKDGHTSPIGVMSFDAFLPLIRDDPAVEIQVPAVATDGSGRATLTGLPEGTASLFVIHASHVPVYREGIAIGDETLTVRLATGGALEVICPQAEGEPCALQRAGLISLPMAGQKLINGRARFPFLPAGEYQLVIGGDGGLAQLGSVVIVQKTKGDDPEADPTAGEGADAEERQPKGPIATRTVRIKSGETTTIHITPEATATIEGEILVGGEYVGFAQVVLLSGENWTNQVRTVPCEGGRFVLPGVPHGRYRLIAMAENVKLEGECNIPAGAKIVKVRLESGNASIEGTVLDENDQPIENVAVLLEPMTPPDSEPNSMAAVMKRMAGQSETDEQGQFELAGLNAGEYRLVCGHGTRITTQTVKLGASQSVAFTVRFADLQTLTIKVVGADGKPLAGRVVLNRADGSIGESMVLASDDDFAQIMLGAAKKDTFRFDLTPGKYAVNAGAVGHASIYRRVIELRESRVETIRLDPGVRFDLRLVDAGGQPLTGQFVDLRDERGGAIGLGLSIVELLFHPKQHVTDDDGWLRLPHLASGDLTVNVDGKEIGVIPVGKKDVERTLTVR
ncbi:MAG: sigma-70 family RNA polymerase sigma factor [Planctomycetota bacterium]